MNIQNTSWLVLLPLLVAAAAAQDPAGDLAVVLPEPTTSIVRQAHGLFTDELGELCGGGADYAVRFDRGGMEFTPALGRRAPRSMPLRFTLEAVRRGDSVVWQSALEDRIMRPVRHGDVASYARSGGVTERYEVRPDGVELSFRFARRLPGAGDLVVRGRIVTDLHAEVTGETREGLRFAADDLGAVTIGGVTGIDAAGRRETGSLRYDAGVVEFVLPAGFVERAAYPLVLDPLIGTDFALAIGNFNDSNADAAFGAGGARYLVVWQREFSGADVDLRGQLIDIRGTRVGSMLSLTTTGVNLNPTVANVRNSNRFLVAWQRAPSALGPWDILASGVEASNGTVSGPTTVSANLENETDPDASGDRTVSDNEALVVWDEEGTGIVGAQVTLDSAGNPPVAFDRTVIQSELGRGFDLSDPAISKSGGDNLVHVVVWVESTLAGEVWWSRAVSRNLTLLGIGPFSVQLGPGFDDTVPDIDGDGEDFMVVWQRTARATPGDGDIYYVGLRWDGTGLFRTTFPFAIAAGSGDDEVDPAVGFLGPKYLVAWSDASGQLDYDIVLRGIGSRNLWPCGPEIVVVGPNIYDRNPEIATRWAGGDSSFEAIVVFSSMDRTPPFESDVRGQRYAAFGSGGSRQNLGGGCGVAGSYSFGGGPIALGNRFLAAGLTGSGGILAVLNFSLPRAPNRCGSCLILPVAFSGSTVAVTNGSAFYPLPVPCNPSLIGATLDSQWLVLTPLVAPCIPGIDVSASDILRITIGT